MINFPLQRQTKKIFKLNYQKWSIQVKWFD